jgi:hypothetical protein
MRVNSITRVGFAVVVEANGGENQLTLLASPGQDGTTSYSAIATEVDGGCEVIADGACRTLDLVQAAARIFLAWWRPNALGRDSDRAADLERFLDVIDEQLPRYVLCDDQRWRPSAGAAQRLPWLDPIRRARAMKIDSITRVGSAVVVIANGGESQLTVLASPDDDSVAYAAVATGAGGTCETVTEDWCPAADFETEIAGVFLAWWAPKAAGQGAAIHTDLDRFLDYVCDGCRDVKLRPALEGLVEVARERHEAGSVDAAEADLIRRLKAEACEGTDQNQSQKEQA